LAGSEDEHVPLRDLEEWGHLFSHVETVNIIDGDHFFIDSNMSQVLEVVVNALATKAASDEAI
jgi:surfactin synthase thioesterase subunit